MAEGLAPNVEGVPPEGTSQNQSNLTLFGAAIGGAILGLLLSLMVLAVINGGTLLFSESKEISELRAEVSELRRENAEMRGQAMQQTQFRYESELITQLQIGELQAQIDLLREMLQE